MRIHIRTLVSVLCALFFPGAAAFAQRPPPSAPTELDFPLVDVYGQKRAFAESLDFGEKVNLDTGELTFQVTDVSIPGNSALAVQFGRRLMPRSFLSEPALYTPFGLGGWIADIPMITGVVSKDYYDGTQGPSVWPGVPYLGGPRGFWKGLYLVIPGQAAKKLHWTKPGTAEYARGYGFVTEDYWVVKRTMGASVAFEAVSPEGTRYQFTHPLRVPETKGFGIVAATDITDIHGNWVKYRYNGPNLNAAAAGVYSNNLSRIDSNDGRLIDINYAGDAKVSSVVANGRAWSYQYDAGTLDSGRLRRVALPDGRFWEYTNPQSVMYGPTSCGAPVNANVTVKHPSGMSATYNVRTIFNGRINLRTTYSNQPTSCLTAKPGTSSSTFEVVNYGHESIALFSKTLTVPGAGTYVWNYAYQQDFGATGGSFGLSATKSRTVTQPDGSQTRTFIHRLVDFQEGMIVREETLSSAAQVLESRSFTYQPSSDLWEPHAFFALGDVDRALRRIAKLTTRRELARGGDTYTTEFFYRANPQVAAYDFTQPYEVRRSSTLQAGQRITQFAYQHDTTQWLIGLPLSLTENGKIFDQYGYDGKGRVVSYDRFGTRIASYGYFTSGTAAGMMNWFDDALGHRTTYDAYKRGKPQSVLRSDGNTVSQVIDNNGWVTRLTDARGTPEDYQYNSMGWLTQIDRPGIWEDTTVSYSSLGNGLVQTQTRGPERITVTLDGMIRPILERREALSGGGGSIYTKTAYDGLSRVTLRSFPSTSANPSAGVTFSYDGLGRLTQTRENVSPNATTNFAYLAGNATRLTDPIGAVTTTSRSGYGGPDDGGPTLIQRPLGVNTTVGYDIWGAMTSVRQTGSLNGFSVDETKNYYYDLNRRLCRLHTLEGGDTVYAYDSAGHLTAYQKGLPAGSACSAPSGAARVGLSYDSLGRPTYTDYADAATPDISRTYDANGNPLTVNRNGVNWSYAYNELNALTRETLAVDGRSYLCSYAYNTLGQIVSHTLPSGRSLALTYDGLGRTTSIASGSAVYAQSMAYHPNGTLSGFTYGNGQVFTQTLTERQMPWRLRSAQGANTALDLTYSYDARGKITGVVNAALGGGDRSYGYDALGRLTGASGPWGAGSYVYDALGNLRQKTEGSRTVTNSYNANNQVGASAASGLPTRSFGYDARGNVTAIDGLQFGYDFSDQPTVLSGSAAGAYRYDGRFKRVKSTVNGKTLYNVFDASGTLIHIDNVTDNQQTDLVGRVARITNNVVTYLHPDHLGSAQAGTNASGAIAWREQYTPFGEALQRPPANDDQAGYTGHIQDKATGLTYMQARYYDAALGRFLSVDPVDPVDPVGSSGYDLNLYAYVGNDPVNRTDPTGLYTCSGNTSDCKQVDNFVSAATKAAGNLDKKSDAYAKVEKVLGYLGKAGDKNGVVLNPTSLAKGTLASASPNGKINVDVGQISSAASKVYGPANPGVSAGDLRNGVGGSVVAHEARHEIDFQKNGFPNSKASEYRTELNAYKTQIGVERGLGITGLSNSQMSEDQLNGAAAAGAQRSVDAWCAAGGSCQ